MTRWVRWLSGKILEGLPPPGSRTLRFWLSLLMPWLLVVGGLTLGVASSTPEVAHLGTRSLQGSVDSNSTVEIALNESGSSYSILKLEPLSACGLRVYPLDAVAADQYRLDGRLPDASRSLNCDRLAAVENGEVSLLILANRLPSPLDYSLTIDRFVLRVPYAVFSIPAFALVLIGAAAILIGRLRTGTFQILDRIGEEEDPVPYWTEEDRKP